MQGKAFTRDKPGRGPSNPPGGRTASRGSFPGVQKATWLCGYVLGFFPPSLFGLLSFFIVMVTGEFVVVADGCLQLFQAWVAGVPVRLLEPQQPPRRSHFGLATWVHPA